MQSKHTFYYPALKTIDLPKSYQNLRLDKPTNLSFRDKRHSLLTHPYVSRTPKFNIICLTNTLDSF